jgi:eukaryotic-like serine/threonine-protein kinase
MLAIQNRPEKSMAYQPTIVAEANGGAGGDSRFGTCFGIPADLLDKGRRRLGIFALVIVVNATIAIVVAGPLWRALGFADVTFMRVVQSVVLGLSIVMVVLVRSNRVAHSTLLKVGLVYLVVLCFMGSMGQSSLLYEASGGQLPVTTVADVFIVAYPLIVPGPPGLTLLAAVAGAASVPLGLVILEVLGAIAISPVAYVAPTMFAAFSAVLAIVGARVIYGMTRDVARARELGSYQLETLLGRGGMGEVWRARHRLLVRPAAIKLLRPDLLVANPEIRDLMVRRFEREAQSTASLRCANTIQLYDFGTSDAGAFYFVMELLDGLDAEDLVAKYGPVSPERAVHLLKQVCRSLAEAHDVGLTHRDIKPSNVFICRYGREVDFVKVLDFGLVKPRDTPEFGDSRLTTQGVISGTPNYMPPEQAAGEELVDERTDLYALGCVAYWLVTGRLVFDGRTPLEVMAQHLQATPIPPSQRANQAIPAAYDEMVLACLAKNPSQRPQSADELAERLERCTGETVWTEGQAREWWASHHAPNAERTLA